MVPVFVFIFITLSFPDSAYSLCHHNWIMYGDSCYLISNSQETWAEAMIHCKALADGAGLVEIETSEENEFLKSHLLNETSGDKYDEFYWLGGSDIAKENEWNWVRSDEPMGFTDWNPGQPDDFRNGEDCLEMHKEYNFRWDDRPCNSHFRFICEQPLFEVIG